MLVRKESPDTLDGGGGDTKTGNKDCTNTINAARDWVRLNPELWAELNAWAVGEAKAERKFSIMEYMQSIRWHDRVNAEGYGVKVNNDHAPIFARWIVNAHPIVRPYIELRKSKYDTELLAVG